MTVDFKLIPFSNMKLFSYVVARDYGFAPNPFFGYCTLATCKQQIRAKAMVDDWIIGTSSRNSHQCQNRLVYAMKVVEKLSFNEYWDDKRFQNKKPVFNKSKKFAYGDNIYHEENGAWYQEKSHHRKDEFNVKNYNRDTSADKVLISNEFIYFGSEPIEIPKKLVGIDLCGQGHKCNFEQSFISEVDEWLKEEISASQFTHQPRPAKWIN